MGESPSLLHRAALLTFFILALAALELLAPRGAGALRAGGDRRCARCLASPPRAVHLYLDLGANRGNTIQLFLLDPAFTLAAANNKDDFRFPYNPTDFRVVGVEAMRSTHGAALEALQRRYPAQVEIIWAAVGAEGGGTLRIYRDEGASAEGEWGAGIQPRFSKNYEDVPTLDASSWLADNACACDFVVVKCNIEGSEFALLDKMIAQRTLELVDVVHMYFHPQFFPQEERALVKRIDEVYRPAFDRAGVLREVWSVH
jgi:hypothetical protein